MKKFLVVLLSLGLLVAFGATASAATDVKFSGSYYVVGVYDNNMPLADENKTYSRAFFYQRVRLQPVFQVAEGLTLTTRIDALEKQWGQTDWRGSFDDKTNSRRETQSFGNPKIQENFEFERGYVEFMTAIGKVSAGYMSSGKWGTDFGDDENTRPRARIDGKVGPVNWGVVYEKEFEADTSSQAGYAGKADADADSLALYGLYNFKGGSAGLLYKFVNRAQGRVTANNRTKTHSFLPVVKATFGPVYLEGEVIYAFGKAAQFDSGGTDMDLDQFGAYLKVRANVGPAYFGAMAQYGQGDDNPTDTTVKASPGSPDLNYGLILGRDELFTWTNASGHSANGAAAFDGQKTNAIIYSVFGGFNPSPKKNIEAMLVSASRDKVAANYVSKNMGIEFDVTASYKIYDNLTYMVGAGYLWTGDYFKGTNSANVVGNDYLLQNKLTLSF
jgi:hypothetical protein